MENLISMTDFVLEQERDFNEGITGWKEYTNSTINYAKFLKKPLQVSMFLPCDYKGNIVKIIPFNEHKKGSDFEFNQHYNYQQGKNLVLFNGVTEDYVYFIIKTYKNIEGLLDVTFDLTLTETAKKNVF